MKKSTPLWIMLLLVHSAVTHAKNLQVDEATNILRASKSETSLTDHEKLYVYRCEMIRKYLGFTETPTGLATKYSCDKPEIGIAFFAGDDLGHHSPQKIGEYFKNPLERRKRGFSCSSRNLEMESDE